jgi:hypothetical protein
MIALLLLISTFESIESQVMNDVILCHKLFITSLLNITIGLKAKNRGLSSVLLIITIDSMRDYYY